MTNLQTRYLIFRHDKEGLEKEASSPAQRMLDFLRRVAPTNYVKYRLWGDDKKDTLDRFVLETESTDSLEYRGTHVDERSGKWEYFSVPLSYLDAPDEWEKEIESRVKADRKLVRKAVKELFGDRIEKKEYDLSAFPGEFGETRFMRVMLHCKYKNKNYDTIEPKDPVLAEIVSGYHPGFVYDKETGLFYLDGWIKEASSLSELILIKPELAKDRVFRGTEVNSTHAMRIR